MVLYGYPGPPIDITSILEPGGNHIQVIIQDIYHAMIGCTPLTLVQVYEPINYDQRNRYFNPFDFINDFPQDFDERWKRATHYYDDYDSDYYTDHHSLQPEISSGDILQEILTD